MTQNKRFAALLLALALLVTLLPQMYFLLRADADDSGTCGANLKWELTGDTLKITGYGAMTNYNWVLYSTSEPGRTSAPWGYYPNEIHLPEGLTSIGSYAFADSYVKEMKIPANVTRIGVGAFHKCYFLKRVTIKNRDCVIEGKYTFGSHSDTVICGYPGSTAETYAKENDYRFEPYEPITFADVDPQAYYADAVNWAIDAKVTKGTDDTHFSPDDFCTRAQVVTFLHRAEGEPEPMSTAHPFVDADPGAYYYKAMLWAVENGITKGIDQTHFGPKNPCTRAQVVTFLHRARYEPAPNTISHPFVDVDPGAYYYNAMLWAVETKVTNGTDTTHFSPDNICTRGQVVTFLYRAKDLAKGGTPLAVTVEASSTKINVDEKDDQVILTAKVSGGNKPYTYQWQKYSSSLGWGSAFGQNNSTWIIKEGGTYRCKVTDAAGTAVYSETVTITPMYG